MTTTSRWVIIISTTLAWVCGAAITMLGYSMMARYPVLDNKSTAIVAVVISILVGICFQDFIAWRMAMNDARDFHKKLHKLFVFQPVVDERLSELAEIAKQSSLRAIELQQKLGKALIEEEPELREELGMAEADFRGAQEQFWEAVRHAKLFGLKVPEKSFKECLRKSETSAA